MPFSLFLALKYLKPKRSLASVITCVSVLGIVLGVAIVIIVRAVMTGFGDLWEQKILDFKPHVTVIARSGHGPAIYGEKAICEKIRAIAGVKFVTPSIETQILLERNGYVGAPVLIGLDPDSLGDAMKVGAPVSGKYDLDGDSIVLGEDLANQLGIYGAGQKVTVYSPKTLVSRDEVFLPIRWTVTGIYSSGHRDYDSKFAICSLANMRDLLGMDRGVFAIHVKVDRPTDEAEMSRIIKEIAAVAPNCRPMHWRDTDRGLFNALAVEKNMMALLLTFITVVAMFCVMNTLLVLSVQKTPEIGLMKALGFPDRRIMGAFMTHGLIQCVIGVILGLGAAWLVLHNLQNLVDLLAKFGVQVFPKSVYGLDSIPHRVVISDVAFAVVSVFVMGLVASLIPAWVAVRKNPVEALKK